jgi:Flp pilus assembly pilin Flp
MWPFGVTHIFTTSEYARRKRMLKRFILDEGGQDLVEYTLLMAFVALAAAAIFIAAGQSITGIWSKANSQLKKANDAAI